MELSETQALYSPPFGKRESQWEKFLCGLGCRCDSGFQVAYSLTSIMSTEEGCASFKWGLVVTKRLHDLTHHSASGGCEVSCACDNLTIPREKGCRRPAAHVAACVNVRAAVVIYFDRNKVSVDECGDLRLVICVCIHPVAPVAPHSPNVQDNRLVTYLRFSKRLAVPFPPTHQRLTHSLLTHRISSTDTTLSHYHITILSLLALVGR